MNGLLKKFLLMGVFASLAACGGGGSSSDGGGGDQTVAIKLSGLVYDEEIGGAVVEAYVGSQLVGTATTDATGNYTLNLTVSESQYQEQCVVRARVVDENFSLATLPGTVGEIAGSTAAGDGTVSGSENPDLNVTNVSTAVYAVVKSQAQTSGTTPESLTAAELEAIKQTIEGDTATQDKIKYAAAAIKAVIDYGATNSSSDTEALADAIVGSADPQGDVDTLLQNSNLTVTTTELVTEVESDPTLAVQLIEAPIAAADIAGKRYHLGGNNMVTFNADNTLTVEDYDYFYGSGPVPAGTWSLSGDQLSLEWGNGSDNYVVTVLGGTSDVFNGTYTGTQTDSSTGATANVSGTVVFTRTLNASDFLADTTTQALDMTTVPGRMFHLDSGEMVVQDSSCDGASADGEFAFNDFSGGLSCSIKSEAFLSTPYVDVGTGTPVAVTPRVCVPLVGSTSSTVRMAAWIPDIDTTTGNWTGDVTTQYRAMKAPIDITPLANKTANMYGAFRIRNNGRYDIAFQYPAAGTVKIFKEKDDGSYAIIDKSISDAVDSVSGAAIRISQNATNTSHIYQLSGGTSGVSYQGVHNVTGGTAFTRYSYAMGGFTLADVAGKTFTLTGQDGDVTTVVFDNFDGVGDAGTLSYSSSNGDSGTAYWKLDLNTVLPDGKSPLVTMNDPTASDGQMEWHYRSVLSLNATGSSFLLFNKTLTGVNTATPQISDIWMDTVTVN